MNRDERYAAKAAQRGPPPQARPPADVAGPPQPGADPEFDRRVAEMMAARRGGGGPPPPAAAPPPVSPEKFADDVEQMMAQFAREQGGGGERPPDPLQPPPHERIGYRDPNEAAVEAELARQRADAEAEARQRAREASAQVARTPPQAYAAPPPQAAPPAYAQGYAPQAAAAAPDPRAAYARALDEQIAEQKRREAYKHEYVDAIGARQQPATTAAAAAAQGRSPSGSGPAPAYLEPPHASAVPGKSEYAQLLEAQIAEKRQHAKLERSEGIRASQDRLARTRYETSNAALAQPYHPGPPSQYAPQQAPSQYAPQQQAPPQYAPQQAPTQYAPQQQAPPSLPTPLAAAAAYGAAAAAGGLANQTAPAKVQQQQQYAQALRQQMEDVKLRKAREADAEKAYNARFEAEYGAREDEAKSVSDRLKRQQVDGMAGVDAAAGDIVQGPFGPRRRNGAGGDPVSGDHNLTTRRQLIQQYGPGSPTRQTQQQQQQRAFASPPPPQIQTDWHDHPAHPAAHPAAAAAAAAAYPAAPPAGPTPGQLALSPVGRAATRARMVADVYGGGSMASGIGVARRDGVGPVGGPGGGRAPPGQPGAQGDPSAQARQRDANGQRAALEAQIAEKKRLKAEEAAKEAAEEAREEARWRREQDQQAEQVAAEKRKKQAAEHARMQEAYQAQEKTLASKNAAKIAARKNALPDMSVLTPGRHRPGEGSAGGPPTHAPALPRSPPIHAPAASAAAAASPPPRARPPPRAAPPPEPAAYDSGLGPDPYPPQHHAGGVPRVDLSGLPLPAEPPHGSALDGLPLYAASPLVAAQSMGVRFAPDAVRGQGPPPQWDTQQRQGQAQHSTLRTLTSLPAEFGMEQSLAADSALVGFETADGEAPGTMWRPPISARDPAAPPDGQLMRAALRGSREDSIMYDEMDSFVAAWQSKHQVRVSADRSSVASSSGDPGRLDPLVYRGAAGGASNGEASLVAALAASPRSTRSRGLGAAVGVGHRRGLGGGGGGGGGALEQSMTSESLLMYLTAEQQQAERLAGVREGTEARQLSPRGAGGSPLRAAPREAAPSGGESPLKAFIRKHEAGKRGGAPPPPPAVPPPPQSLSPSGKALAAVPLSTIGGERGEGFGLGSLDLVSSADGGGAGSVDELVAFEASAAAGESGVFAVNEVAPAPVEEAARSAATAAANDELAALLA